MPGVIPLLLRGHQGSPFKPPPLREGGRGGNRRCPPWRHSSPRPAGAGRAPLCGGCALPAPPGPDHRGCLGLLRPGRPFHQIPRERHPQTGIILPAGCVVSAPLPSLSGPALAGGGPALGGGNFLSGRGLRPLSKPPAGGRSEGCPLPPSAALGLSAMLTNARGDKKVW